MLKKQARKPFIQRRYRVLPPTDPKAPWRIIFSIPEEELIVEESKFMLFSCEVFYYFDKLRISIPDVLQKYCLPDDSRISMPSEFVRGDILPGKESYFCIEVDRSVADILSFDPRKTFGVAGFIKKDENEGILILVFSENEDDFESRLLSIQNSG